MQSENGILLLFYIFLSHGNGKKMKKGGMLCLVHKYLWYYMNKLVFQMNNYSFLTECFDFSFTSTEKILTPKNGVGLLEIKSQ
jgi:hypothetical protein